MVADILAWAQAHWTDILAIWGATVALATLIVRATPSQADDAFLAKVIKVVDYFSVVNPKKGEDAKP